MKSFRKNVLRLAMRNKSSVFGAILIIAIGIFVFVSMLDTLRNLDDQIQRYYKDFGMADIFAEVEGISSTELERMEEIPGIREAGGHMAKDVRILGPGQETIVSVHLMSWDPKDSVNRIHIEKEPQTEEDLFLGIRMSAYYQYEEGTVLRLLWDGSALPFDYRGTCRAPDYIYSIPHGGAMVPDGEIYDMAVISRERMEKLLGKSDSLNELGFILKDGYSYEDVRHQLTDRLAPYGLHSIAERADQPSANMVEGEMVELISTGTILPLLFMAISVFMLYVVLKKMIDRDRALIGTMKAFGMSNSELMRAYLTEGVLIGTAGALLGGILAGPLGRFMFDLYIEFFSLPDPVYHDFLNTRIMGLAISLVTSVLAVFLGVRELLGIAPASAMRQPEPAAGKMLDLPAWFQRHLKMQTRIGLRSMGRHPFRGILVILAVVFAFSLTSSLFCFMPVFDELLQHQFEEIQAYDLQLTMDCFVSPLRAESAGSLIEEAKEAEAVCQTAVALRNGNLTDYTVLYGLQPDSGLYRIRDNDGTIYAPPEGEIILNAHTAENLHVREGDMIEISAAGLTNDYIPIRVRATMRELLGRNCYISLDSFEDVFCTGSMANTLLLQIPKDRKEKALAKLMQSSRISWIVDTEKIVAAYRGMIDSMVYMVDMFGLLSVAAGAILIYNISLINLKERFTELGTLQVLGMKQQEIGNMLLTEKLIYYTAGILLGFPGSWGVNRLLEVLIISEDFDIRLHIGTGIYFTTAVICFFMVLAAWYAEQKLIRSIDLTDILKARE